MKISKFLLIVFLTPSISHCAEAKKSNDQRKIDLYNKITTKFQKIWNRPGLEEGPNFNYKKLLHFIGELNNEIIEIYQKQLQSKSISQLSDLDLELDLLRQLKKDLKETGAETGDEEKLNRMQVYQIYKDLIKKGVALIVEQSKAKQSSTPPGGAALSD